VICVQNPERIDERAQAEWGRSFTAACQADGVVPEIFRWKQTLVLHTGSKPYHPANRRVTLSVTLDDLRVRYGLSDAATRFLVEVCFASDRGMSLLSNFLTNAFSFK
jgi:hypothetical protein